jgi:hypothetical protein
MSAGRVVTIPFPHGKLDVDGTLIEPNIEALLEKWLERHPRYKIWVEQCQAAEQIEAEFGTQKAMGYLVGEKLLNFLEASESNVEWRREIPQFIAKIKDILRQNHRVRRNLLRHVRARRRHRWVQRISRLLQVRNHGDTLCCS